jgi:hypothetical protein
MTISPSSATKDLMKLMADTSVITAALDSVMDSLEDEMGGKLNITEDTKAAIIFIAGMWHERIKCAK